MICEECREDVDEHWLTKYNDHVFCSAVCLEEWYENKRQERGRR